MEEEFNKIFAMYKEDLFHLIYSYTLNISDTKDILQNTFMKYLQKMNKVSKDELEIKKWLIRVAVNECKDLKKSYWKRNIKTNIEEDKTYIKNFESNKEMLDLLNRIDKKYRIPIYLYYYEGYSILEISEILRLSESAVKMRLKRAKELLKKEMEVV